MSGVDVIGPHLAALLECVRKNLSCTVGRVVVMPGNMIVEDDCCEGQLHVRLVSVVGSSAMTNPRIQPCAPLYQCRVGIGVTRCAHVVSDAGIAPTPAEMTADAFQTYQDMIDIVQAVNCCFAAYESVGALRIEEWLPTPVSTCVGGEVTITFSLNLCQPCPPTD